MNNSEVSAPDLWSAEIVLLDVRADQAVLACIDPLARLDVLVNCAGVLRRSNELQPAVFADVVDINLNGTLRMGAADARCLVPPTAAQYRDWQLMQPSAGTQFRRAVAPHSPVVANRFGTQMRLEISGTRLGGAQGSLCL